MWNTIKNAARKGVQLVKNNVKAVAAAITVGAATLATPSAHAVGPDLTGVTGPITDLGTSTVTAAGTVITAALGVGAVFFGGRALWRFFKSLAK